MIQFIYNKNIIIYTFAVLCGLGIIVRFILDLVHIYLVRESDNLGLTKNKLLKHMKMRFETCYRLNIGVNNVDTFVDKSLTKYKFCGILLSTWENFSGQVLLLSFLIIPVSAIFGVVFDISREQILYTGAVGVLACAALVLVDKMINLSVKKQMIRLNLLDYLENFCKVRLEHEVSQPEKLEQFRKEYLAVISTKQNDKKSESDKREEINRRKEARKRKQEERRLQALKREEELKRLEEARREEEKRKLEERKLLAAKRREEELKKLQEEREKQRQNYMKKKEKDEKESPILQSIEEAAAHREESISPVMSSEEEKLVEDVLREFFA